MRGVADAIEIWLEQERDQLALWLPIFLAAGIGLWFALANTGQWIAVILAGLGLACGSAVPGLGRRAGKAMLCAGLALSFGCALIWARAEFVSAPRLDRPIIAKIEASVVRVEAQPVKKGTRLLLDVIAGDGVPPRVRVSAKPEQLTQTIMAGDRVRLRARLMPPPEAAVPGGYDFSRAAWFMGLGATGSSLGAVERVESFPEGQGLRERLSAHIHARLEGSEGGIAAAFATGDRAAIAPADEEAMRASGLTHLLSVSGLHITAVVAAAMFLTLRLLALSTRLALRAPLLLVAAGAGALAGIGYTLLTGAQVPTVRSCIAALLVLAGLALGREAITLRLVATGALVVLLLWPEALVGPSFQLSFAAITAIVALHEHPAVQRLTMKRDEGLPMRLARSVGGLLMTGLVVEIFLAPVALYHFHKSGLYGALANIVAIPLTTFVIMPLEAVALLLDVFGLRAPIWSLTGSALGFLLWLARTVASLPGAMAALPSVPLGAFLLMISGGCWLLLWRSRPRWLGLAPIGAGAIWAIAVPAPDLLITGDGRHLALRSDSGVVGLLRPRAGDYVRDLLAERSGEIDALKDVDNLTGARCGPDLCVIELRRGERIWRIAATRSGYRLPWKSFVATCAAADIIISDRWLPRGCQPRWLKVDRQMLAQTGGLAITLVSASVERVRAETDDHPWRRRSINNGAGAPRAVLARQPVRAGNAAAGASGSPDRAGSSNLRGGNI